MIREGGFSREYLVEEEFPRLRYVLVDLKFLHARFLLRLRQKILQKARNRNFLARIDFPERGHDQVLIRRCHIFLL